MQDSALNQLVYFYIDHLRGLNLLLH